MAPADLREIGRIIGRVESSEVWPSGQLGHTSRIRPPQLPEIGTYLSTTTETHDFTSTTDSAPKADADMPQVVARKVYHQSLMTNGVNKPDVARRHC